MTKRALFYTIQFIILVFGVTFPFWQTTDILDMYHPLWIIVPGVLFSTLFIAVFGKLFNFSDTTVRRIKKIVFYWLGGGFIWFSVSLFLLLVNVFLGIPETYLIAIGAVLSVLLITYAYYNAAHIYAHAFVLRSEKLSKKYQFIQLSDIHIGSNGRTEVQRMVQKIKNLEYDFVVITGDLLDQDYAPLDAFEEFKKISKPIYYITGNHEYYLRHKNFSEFIEKTDMLDINDKKVVFDDIAIYGIDEHSDSQVVLDTLNVDTDSYNIMLMHEPNTPQMKQAEKQGIDLALSGHTHNGQVFPFTLMVKARYKFLSGLYELGNMNIHVSQGTGTWGPKMRLGTQNEITHITLQPGDK